MGVVVVVLRLAGGLRHDGSDRTGPFSILTPGRSLHPCQLVGSVELRRHTPGALAMAALDTVADVRVGAGGRLALGLASSS
jgi:hypothetical protein